MKKIKSILAFVLVLCMVISLAPISVLAADKAALVVTTSAGTAEKDVNGIDITVYKVTFNGTAPGGIKLMNVAFSFDNTKIMPVELIPGGTYAGKYADIEITSESQNTECFAVVGCYNKYGSTHYNVTAADWYEYSKRTAVSFSVSTNNAVEWVAGQDMFTFTFRLANGVTEADLTSSSLKIETSVTGAALGGLFTDAADRKFGVRFDAVGGTQYFASEDTATVSITHPGSARKDALVAPTVALAPVAEAGLGGLTITVTDANNEAETVKDYSVQLYTRENNTYTASGDPIVIAKDKMTDFAVNEELATTPGPVKADVEYYAKVTANPADANTHTAGTSVDYTETGVAASRAASRATSIDIDGDTTLYKSLQAASPTTETYTATLLDQYGVDMDTQPTDWSWSIKEATHTGISIAANDPNSTAKLTVGIGAAIDGSYTVVAKSASNSTISDGELLIGISVVSFTSEPRISGGGTITIPALKSEVGADIEAGTNKAELTLTKVGEPEYDSTWSVKYYSDADCTAGEATADPTGVTFSGETNADTAKFTVTNAASPVWAKVTLNVTADTSKNVTKIIAIEKAGPVATYITLSGDDAATVKATEQGTTYTAEVYDQYGIIMDPQPEITWTSSFTPVDNSPTAAPVVTNDGNHVTVPAGAKGGTFRITASFKEGVDEDKYMDLLVTRDAQVATSLKVFVNDGDTAKESDTLLIPMSGNAKTASYTAVAYDQFGIAMANQPLQTWTCPSSDTRLPTGTTWSDLTNTLSVAANSAAVEGTHTGTFKLKVALTDNDAVAKEIEISVTKLNADWSGITTKASPVYGDTNGDIILGEDATSIDYNTDGTDTYGSTLTGTYTVTDATTVQGAGEKTITVKFTADPSDDDNGDYKNVVLEKTYTVSIAKATPTADDFAPSYQNTNDTRTYNGSSFEVSAGERDAMGTLTIKFGAADATEAPAESIEAKNAGTYTVWAVVGGNDNYNPATVKLLDFVINKAAITGYDSPAPTPGLDAFTAYETNKLTDLEAVKAVGNDTSIFPATRKITYDDKTADVNMKWTYKSGTYDAKGANYTFTGTPDLTTGNGLNFTNTGNKTMDVWFVVSSITGTPTWTVTSLTKAKSEVKDITGYSNITGLPTTVAVAYDPGSTGAGATKTYDIDGWSVPYTTIKNSAPTDTTNVVYTDMTPTIKWPAWLTLAESPELKTTLTITNKYPVTVTLPDQTGREYNKTEFTVTPASAVDNGHGLGVATQITYSYSGKAYAVGDTTEATGADYGPSATAPTNAGQYTVTATYENTTHYGVSETKTFTIEQKEVIIAFNAAGITSPGDHSKYPYYTYDNTPHGPTATVAVGYLETDDDCTVTLEYIGKAYLASDASVDVANGAAYTDGVAPKNAGVYRAQVSETSLSNPNYTPAIVAYVYAIAKADRGTLSVTDKTGNTVDTTSKLLLYPTQLTDTLVPSVTSNLDKDATFTFVSGNTATVTVNNAGLVTAVANDPGVTVTVTCPATGNYNEKIANVTVVSAPQPITELNVRSSGPGDALTASVNDEKQTITVTGFITEGATLDVVYESIASSGQPATLPISGGTRVPILISSSNPRVGIYYNVDTSGVTILPAGVTITKGTMEPPDTSAIEDDDDRAAVETALAGADVNGLGAAASEAIIAKAKALSEANSGHAIEAQVYLSIKAVEYNAGEKFFTIDITPMVKYVDKGDGDKVLATDPIPDSAVKSPVTITINTPGWYVANDKIFVDHRNVTVAATTAGGKTSWTQDSFSPSTLFVNNLRGRIEYTFEDKTVQTISYNAIDLGKSLPTDSKPGYNFNGWDISIKDPKATGALTIVEKSQTTMTPKLLGEVCSSLSGVTAKPTFTPAGGGMTSYTITAEAGENGRLEPFGRVSVSAGGSKTFTITPDEGYVVDKLTVDGKSVEAANTYTFQDVGADHTISVTFKKAVDKFFEDVAKTDWFYDDVYAVYEKGLMDGVSDEPMLFDPAGITNRAMAVTVLWRLAGEPEPSGNMPFTDVPADQWYTKAISWAADLKVVDGVTPTTFEPLTSVTREQLAALLYRYALYFAKTADPADATGDLSAFADGGEVSGWAVESMRWCVAKGLIEGRTGTKELDPLGFAQRSELAALLNRFASKIG